MAFDSARGFTTSLLGDRSPALRVGEEWNGEPSGSGGHRTHLPLASPGGGRYIMMVFESARGEIVPFGGPTATNDSSETWVLGSPPSCSPDVNRDGAVNRFDVEAVEQGVNGGPCP